MIVSATEVGGFSGHLPRLACSALDQFARFGHFLTVCQTAASNKPPMCTIPPTAPNVDHSRKPNPPVQMRNDIWRPPLSLLRWRLLPLLLPPLCVAAVENTGEDDDHNEANETSDEELAKSGGIRHLWRALPADCLPVSTCAALVTCWGGGRAPWKEQQPAPSTSMEGLYGSRTGREQRGQSPPRHRQPAKHSTLH